jgi:hypothetical protein
MLTERSRASVPWTANGRCVSGVVRVSTSTDITELEDAYDRDGTKR